ncbi:helix-turn-helix domain-containing protein [Vibrio sp. 10N.222.55.A3]|uniref:helix-turn-helix domain-containing protein n=1 Tax=unclassified Vibrio TaxID=2614977 RepID=UPI003553A758
MNDQLTPINKDHLKKLIRAELEPTWFDKQSVSPDMSWVTPAVFEILFTELITHTRGNQSKAARVLGINRGNLLQLQSNHHWALLEVNEYTRLLVSR